MVFGFIPIFLKELSGTFVLIIEIIDYIPIERLVVKWEHWYIRK
jgi:hypothetical protein